MRAVGQELWRRNRETDDQELDEWLEEHEVEEDNGKDGEAKK